MEDQSPKIKSGSNSCGADPPIDRKTAYRQASTDPLQASAPLRKGEGHAGSQSGTEEVRRFGTNVKELERLRAWLQEKGCTEAVMGEHGFVLETGVQHFGGKPEDHFGKSGASEGAEGKENGSE